jgi:hypothetical protein
MYTNLHARITQTSDSRRSRPTEDDYRVSDKQREHVLVWALLVRPDLTDRIDGYRIYGVVANVLFGLGWILFGATPVVRGRTTEAGGLIPATSPSS